MTLLVMTPYVSFHKTAGSGPRSADLCMPPFIIKQVEGRWQGCQYCHCHSHCRLINPLWEVPSMKILEIQGATCPSF